MEKYAFDSKEYVKIRELVATSSQKCLQTFLGMEPRISPFSSTEDGDLRSGIYQSTPKAFALSECLHCKLFEKNGERNGSSNDECTLTVDEILQALLMIEPSYITPWDALLEFASAFHSDEISVLSMIQCVSSIEEFLLDAKFSSAPCKRHNDEKVLPRCIRELMINFVEKFTRNLFLMMNPIVDKKTKTLNQTQCESKCQIFIKLGFDLLRTVFTTSKIWCVDLFDDIVSAIHFRRPSAPTIKTWLELAQLALPLLTNTQVEKIGLILLDLLCESSNEIPPAQDLPLIISIVVEIATHRSATSSDVHEGSFKSICKLWRRICLVALYRALTCHDRQCYLQTENYLKEAIAKWSADLLKIWISEIINTSTSLMVNPDHDSIPDWFAFNLISLFTEVLRANGKSTRSGLVDRILGHNLDDSEDITHRLSGNECQSILGFILKGEKHSLFSEEVDKIIYQNSGLFFLKDACASKLDRLSNCGCLVMNSLHLNRCDASYKITEKAKYSALPHAIRLLDMADHILMNCCDENLLQASIFAVVAKSVAYFEVPEFRIILERKIEKDVSKPSRLQNFHFSTLCSIVGSVFYNEYNDEITGRWINIIDRSLPFARVNHLNRILTIPSLPRAGILNISKKLLAPLYPRWLGYKYEVRTCAQPSVPEFQKRFVGGIRGLLELIRNVRWGENEIIAWEILFDLIVKDIPQLPLGNRRWLFQTVALCSTDGIFGTKTVERLLRASTIRISSFFVNDEFKSNIIVQLEEIGSIHRLMTILLRNLATVNGYSESRHITLAQGREAFLRSVLLCKNGKFVQNEVHHGLLEQYHSIQDEEPDTFFFCWLVFLQINFCLLDNAMTECPTIKILENLGNSFSKHRASILNLVSRIKEIESQDLQVEHVADRDRTTVIRLVGFDSMKLESIEPTNKFPFFDLLLEFLFLVPLPARESHDFDDPLSWKVITASGFLINRKYNSSNTTECILRTETIENTAAPFLSISSFLVRSTIHLDCTLSAFEDLVATILLYCQALHSTFEAIEIPCCATIIGNLWNLYQAMASEKASVKIIKYLESHTSESHSVSNDDNYHHSFSLRSIYTESGIDETVQHLRFSCLQPFLTCISSLSNGEDFNTNISQSLLGGILGALVTDLRAGLDGNSGGVPQQLYIVYCMSIEECGSLLFNLREPSFDCSIFHLFREVSITFCDILVTIPLRDAVLFRTTFILAVALFPSMCRDLIRNSLFYSDSKYKTASRMLLHDSYLFDEVLEDCIEILNRWAALREPCSIPWLDIAGSNHSNTKNIATISGLNYYSASKRSSSNRKEGCDGKIPRFVHVPSPTRNLSNSNSLLKETPRNIRLYTKELWSWALSCSLLGLEQKWIESERTIQISDSLGNSEHCKVCSIEWKEFFDARKVELQKSLLRMNQLFGTHQSLQQHDQRGNQIILDMTVMNLPSASRLRFCCLIQCVSRVLVHSIQCLCSFFSSTGAKSLSEEMSIFESFCCLSSWLFVDGYPESDFSVGLFKWLAIASRKRTPGEMAMGRKCDKLELFEKLSMVSKEVHKLYLALHELQKSLFNNEFANGEEHRDKMELMGRFFDGDAADKFRCQAGLKLNSLQQVIPIELQVKSFPDFPATEKVETNPDHFKRKRQYTERRRNVRKPNKKKSLSKNRNKVVDMFMSLDEVASNATRDAYADLEDFLVEG